GRAQRPVEAEAFGDGREVRAQRLAVRREARAGAPELDAHEEMAGLEIGILLAVEDEAVDGGEPAGDGGDDPRPVGAGEGEDMGVFGHAHASSGPKLGSVLPSRARIASVRSALTNVPAFQVAT